MDQLLALVAFSFVSSVTPGPNNVLLWASGAAFGLRRTMPHVVGTAVGIGAMALAASFGAGAIISAVPGLAIVMKLAGSAYLVFLAWQVARAGTPERSSVARPFGLFEAAGFQLLNPKAWIFALGAVTTFRLTELEPILGSVVVAVTMMAVIVPTATLWAGAGEALRQFITTPRRRRLVSLGLAAILLGTVVLVWV